MTSSEEPRRVDLREVMNVILANSKWEDPGEEPSSHTFAEIGCDSLDLMEISMRVEVLVERELTDEETEMFNSRTTVDELMGYLRGLTL